MQAYSGRISPVRILRLCLSVSQSFKRSNCFNGKLQSKRDVNAGIRLQADGIRPFG